MDRRRKGASDDDDRQGRPYEMHRDDDGWVSRAGWSVTRTAGSIVLGCATVCVGLFVLAWSESHVHLGRSLEQATDLGASTAPDGALVTLTGAFSYERPAANGPLHGDFGWIHRRVETCAWVEEKARDSEKPRYVKRWVVEVPDSAAFAVSGYDNPRPALSSGVRAGDGLMVGEMRLAEAPTVLRGETIAPPRSAVDGAAQVREQWAYFGPSIRCRDGSAAIGDQRLAFEVLRTGDLVTVFGRRVGSTIGPYRGRLLVVKGDRDTLRAALRTDAEARSWWWRGAGALALWIGLSLTIHPILRLVAGVPVIGGMIRGAVSLATMGLALALTGGVVLLGWGMSLLSNLFAGLVG